jgi:actin-like ATPase involved in cell morphogenesis
MVLIGKEAKTMIKLTPTNCELSLRGFKRGILAHCDELCIILAEIKCLISSCLKYRLLIIPDGGSKIESS